MCNCHGRCCKCLPATLLTWSGDRDFTGDLDIRNFAGYTSELTERQPPNTSAVWRIRYNPDEDFLQYLTDSRTLVSGSVLDGGAFIDYFPYSPETALLSGPVRDGLMYGLDMVPAGEMSQNLYRWPTFAYANPHTAAVDRNFIGSINLKSYDDNGSPFPANWTIQDHPDNPIDLPWVLELGCVRCGCKDNITWPRRSFTRYDPWVPVGGTGSGYAATDGTASTLTTTTVPGCCLSITDNDKQSIHWPGDEAEPDKQSPCPPDCIVWLSDVLPISGAPFWSGAGARSIPGASFPSDAPEHSAVSLANAAGRTLQLEGWTGRAGGSDVVRAARGDSADVDNVSCIWITELEHAAESEQPHTYSYDMVAGDFQWLTDWLATGNKTLIVDAPWKYRDESWGSTTYDAITSANNTLSRIGSGLSMYTIDGNGSHIDSLSCDSTGLHALAPSGENLFSASNHATGAYLVVNSGWLSNFVLVYPDVAKAAGISGGTALYEYDCTIHTPVPFLPPIVTSETHPCIAVEEQGNGSRIIAGSISLNDTIGAEDRVGMSSVPNIGNLITRIVESA